MIIKMSSGAYKLTSSQPVLCRVTTEEGKVQSWLIGHCSEKFNSLALALKLASSLDAVLCCRPESLPLGLKALHPFFDKEGLCKVEPIGDGSFRCFLVPDTAEVIEGEFKF